MVEEAISDEGGSSSTADVNDDKDDKIITPSAQLGNSNSPNSPNCNCR